MTKRTLSNKSRYSILKLSGFRARMSTLQGRNTIKNRRRKGRKKLKPVKRDAAKKDAKTKKRLSPWKYGNYKPPN